MKKAYLLIGLSALGIRILVAILTGAFVHPELFETHEMARSLLEGKGLVFTHLGGVSYHSFLAPLYPTFCAGVYALTGGSVRVLLILQMLLSSAHALLIARVGERLFNRDAGLAAGFLMAIHPGLVVYSSMKAHPLTFDAFFFTLIFWQLIELRRVKTSARAIATGLVSGLGILSRSTCGIFLPVGVAWLYFTTPRGARQDVLRQSLIVIACALVVVSPWLVRNALLHGRLVFITSNWQAFWLGNNPHATGHGFYDAERIVYERLPTNQKQELLSLTDENQQAFWFRQRAFSFIQENPAVFVQLAAKKFYQFWWFSSNTGVLYPGVWLRSYQLFYAVVLCLAFWGIWYFLPRAQPGQRRAWFLVGLFLLSLSVLQSLHYVEGRHRWAIEPFLLLFSGAGSVALWNIFRKKYAQTH